MSEEPNKPDKAEPVGELFRTINDFFHEKPVRGVLQSIDDFFKNPFPHTSFPVEVDETDKECIITAELPGVKREQIHIDLLGSHVTITVKNIEVITEEDDIRRMYRKRQSVQKSSRTVFIPQPVNEKKAKASYRDGLLEIRIPKIKGKKIQIEE